MMRKLLALMAGDRPMSLAELAQAMGVRRSEAEAGLRELTALGYLQDLACQGDGEKTGGCGGCAARKACPGGNPQHLWILSGKGRRAASRRK